MQVFRQYSLYCVLKIVTIKNNPRLEREMKKILAILPCLFIGSSFAASADTTFSVNSSIQHSCSVTMTDVDMGKVNLKSDTVNLGMLNYRCTKNSPFVLDLKGGNEWFENSRVLLDGTGNSDKLKYRVDLPNIQGEVDSNFPKSLIGTGENQMRWVSFAVLRGQYVKPGIYKDNLMIELSY